MKRGWSFRIFMNLMNPLKETLFSLFLRNLKKQDEGAFQMFSSILLSYRFIQMAVRKDYIWRCRKKFMRKEGAIMEHSNYSSSLINNNVKCAWRVWSMSLINTGSMKLKKYRIAPCRSKLKLTFWLINLQTSFVVYMFIPVFTTKDRESCLCMTLYSLCITGIGLGR